MPSSPPHNWLLCGSHSHSAVHAATLLSRFSAVVSSQARLRCPSWPLGGGSVGQVNSGDMSLPHCSAHRVWHWVGPPHLFSLLHVRPQETGHSLVPGSPGEVLSCTPQCCWPRCWQVLHRPLGPQLVEVVPTACVQRWVQLSPAPVTPSSHGCCGTDLPCPCSQPCQASCPCSSGQPGWPASGQGAEPAA